MKLAITICTIITLTVCQVSAITPKDPVLTAHPTDNIQHLYIEDGVDTVFITCEPMDFEQEVESFRTGRFQYLLLWTGIVTGLIVFFNSR
ncbi:hypothetical protein ACFL96_16605 [Thermoproteota archaeon]